MEKKTRMIMIDDPQEPLSLEGQRLAKEAVERFGDLGTSGGDVQVTMISLTSPFDPTRIWFERQLSKGRVVECLGPGLFWQCPICQIFAREWARYYQTALTRMEEWQDG